jgi:fibronectin-binding autotransporter adhesin
MKMAHRHKARYLHLICGCIALATAPHAHAASGTWNVNSTGNWNIAGNWNPAAVPGTAAGDVVGLNNDISNSRTITINTNVTLGTLNIGDTNSSNSFTLALSSGTFTFNNNGTGAVINQTSASAGDSITARFTLADNLAINNNTLHNAIIARPLTITGNISETGSVRSVTKSGSGAVILGGTNSYTGGTTVDSGAVIFRRTASQPSTGTATFGAGTIVGLGVGGAGFYSEADVNGAFANTLANAFMNATTAIGIDTTAGNFSYSYGGGAGNTRSLVKYGANTLTLNGLSTTAADNYTGTTVIDQGTLAIGADAVLTGGLTFGGTRLSNQVGTLDLSSASLTTGALIVQTENASAVNANTITIGSGRVLATNGNVTVGADLTTLSTGNPFTRLTATGSGSWNVVSSNGTFRVGTPATTVRGGSGILDMSGLANFSADLRTGASGSAGGLFNVGSSVGANGNGNTVLLAANSTISAATVTIGNPSGGDQLTQTLKLGSGTQVINANNINLSAGQRDSADVSFNTAAGTIKIRGAAGGDSDRANLTMLTQINTSAAITANFDVSGHAADMSFNNLTVLDLQTLIGSGLGRSATFSFDTGTMAANATLIGSRSSNTTTGSAALLNATMNIGSAGSFANTASLGTLTMGRYVSTGAITTGTQTMNSTLNITGANTAVDFATATMANYTGIAGFALNSGINISGGSLIGTGGIDMAAGNKGSVTSIIDLTGGTLSVGTAGVSGTNGIYRTITGATVAPTLIVNGGVLNMNGNAIGDASNLITTAFRSGTLSNVGQINGGAGLTKTTSGTLTLSGNNTYTGTTDIAAGTLRIGAGGTAGSISSSSTITGSSGALLAFSRTDDYGGVFANNIGGGLGLGLASGTLTLSGNNTYTGATSIAAGRLRVGPTGVLNSTSGISVSAGAAFDYNGSSPLAIAPTLLGSGSASRATLGGTGTITAALTLDDLGDTLSPGNSPGILAFGESQTWNSFAYVWETNNFVGTTAGTDFDQIAITGALDLTGGSGAYLLDITSLTSGNAAGDAGGFTDTTRAWTILTTTSGITGFDAANWTLSTANFTSTPVATGTWSIRQQGNAIVLDFIVVPEPTTAVLAGCGVILLAWRAVARRRPREHGEASAGRSRRRVRFPQASRSAPV